MLMSGFAAGHNDHWLAIAHHEKIDQLEESNGYNSCDAHLCLFSFTYKRVRQKGLSGKVFFLKDKKVS